MSRLAFENDMSGHTGRSVPAQGQPGKADLAVIRHTEQMADANPPQDAMRMVRALRTAGANVQADLQAFAMPLTGIIGLWGGAALVAGAGSGFAVLSFAPDSKEAWFTASVTLVAVLLVAVMTWQRFTKLVERLRYTRRIWDDRKHRFLEIPAKSITIRDPFQLLTTAFGAAEVAPLFPVQRGGIWFSRVLLGVLIWANLVLTAAWLGLCAWETYEGRGALSAGFQQFLATGPHTIFALAALLMLWSLARLSGHLKRELDAVLKIESEIQKVYEDFKAEVLRISRTPAFFATALTLLLRHMAKELRKNGDFQSGMKELSDTVKGLRPWLDKE